MDTRPVRATDHYWVWLASLTCVAGAFQAHAQTAPSREYVRLGGRVIAIENPAVPATIAITAPAAAPAKLSYNDSFGLQAAIQNGTGTVTWQACTVAASGGTCVPDSSRLSATSGNTTTYTAPASGVSATITATIQGSSPAVSAALSSIPLVAVACDQTACQSKNFPFGNGVNATSTLSVTKMGSWTIASDSTWVLLQDPADSQYKQGPITFSSNQQVSYRVLPDTGVARTAHISVNSQPVFTITQDGTPAFTVVIPSRSTIGPAETAQFALSSGAPAVDWTVSGTSPSITDKGSISPTGVYTAPATLNGPVVVTVAATPTGGGTASTGTVTIQPAICQSSTSCSTAVGIPNTSGTYSLIITNSGTWTPTDSDSWISFTSGARTGDATLSYTVTPNTTATSRPTTISFAGSLAGKNVIITQAPADAVAFSVVNPARSAIGPGETAQFGLNPTVTGVTWVVTSTSPTLANPGGINASGLYTAPASLSLPAVVTVTATAGGISHTGNVTIQPAICQSSTDCGTSVGISNATGTYGLIITNAGTWTPSLPAADNWISFSSGPRTGNATLSYTVSPNSNTSARSTTITFTGSLAGKSVTITQAAGNLQCPGFSSFSVSPSNLYLPLGTARYFQLNVPSPIDPSAGVTWSITPSVGTIVRGDQLGSTIYFAQYTAPNSLAAEQTVTVSAAYTSAVCGNHTETAVVIVSPQATDGTFTFTPPSGSVYANANASMGLSASANQSTEMVEFAIVDSSETTASDLTYSCDLTIYRSSNQVYLRSDADPSTIGPSNFGSYTNLANSQCVVQMSASSSGSSTPTVLAVNPLVIKFLPAFTGVKKIFGRVLTNGTVRINWAQIGFLTIGAGTDLTITSSHSGSFTQGQTGAVYTLTATNTGGGPTSGTVTVADTLPAGLTATAISGTGWTCTLGTLTCTRTDALAGSTAYPAITLTSNVAITTATSVTNSVTVSGGGDTNAANNTGTDVTAVQYALDLVLSGWNITTGPAMLFQAYNSITATAFVVNTSSSNSGAVTLQAPHQINLEPGFHVVAGTASPTFRAVIAPVQ